MDLKKLTINQLRRIARKVGIHVTSTDRKSDILKKLMTPLGHYSMMGDLPLELISSYIGPGLDRVSLANLSSTSGENRELLIDDLESRRFRADDTTFKTAIKHYLRNSVEATEVYGPISSWDVSRVTDMSYMIQLSPIELSNSFRLKPFNVDLSGWDVRNVTDMRNMFRGATSFNADLSRWDVSQVTDMRGMFSYTDSFDADLSGWDVSNVTDMSDMFKSAQSFNGDLSNWDVSRVTDMSSMFKSAQSFNADLSGWDVSQVTDMSDMFYKASSFNSDLSNWDVNSVQEEFVANHRGGGMFGMFYFASSFNPNNAPWCINRYCFTSNIERVSSP